MHLYFVWICSRPAGGSVPQTHDYLVNFGIKLKKKKFAIVYIAYNMAFYGIKAFQKLVFIPHCDPVVMVISVWWIVQVPVFLDLSYE